jgi:thiol:disulfide interchange protein DsbD
MKANLLFILALFLSTSFFTQAIDWAPDKVKTNFSISIKGTDAEVIASISCIPHWHIGPIKLPPGTSAKESELILTKSSDFSLVGNVKEPKPTVLEIKDLGESIAYHEGKVIFTQKIKIAAKKDFVLKGKFLFTTCFSDEEGVGKCLPEYPVDFSIPVKISNAPKDTNIVVMAQADTQSVASIATSPSEDKPGPNNPKETFTKKVDSAPNAPSKQSYWSIFILAFLSGFAALLMPCVFPMIPLTMSTFIKSKSRAQGIQNAMLYGFFIVLVHVLLGLLVVITGSASLLNEMATNPWFNGTFFALLVIFGLSFLGGFEIQLPSSWLNKVNNMAGGRGIPGIFFLALVLSLASFSCTGPILGTLLVGISAKGGGMGLIIGMFAFGLALALPFMMFAIFPSMLNAMPKSGGWLNVVKVVLGFLEIAFALTYLSKVDTGLQLHWLERELFVALEVALFLGLTLYLFGFFRLPHDSPLERLSVGRTMVASMALAFTLYMLPGLWGAPLKLINGFLPPDFYAESPGGLGKSGAANPAAGTMESGMENGPLGIPVFKDYEQAKAYAQKVNKPLFLDFTGWNCINCRAMEQGVWGEPGVLERLKNDVVIASLYVDEEVALPPSEQTTINIDGHAMAIKTVGNKWSAKQIKEFRASTQPYYVMQMPDGTNLNNGSADYQNHHDPKKFQAWLEKGLSEAKNK